MAIDATPGGSTSNSYATVAEADVYMGNRPHSSAWLDMETADKEAALIWATSLIDATVCFTGSASSGAQALAWPRKGMVNRNGFAIADNVIPPDLKRALFEMSAKVAVTDPTQVSEAAAAGITKIKAGPVELNFADSSETEITVVPSTVTGLMPPSWLCLVDDPSLRTPIFQVL